MNEVLRNESSVLIKEIPHPFHHVRTQHCDQEKEIHLAMYLAKPLDF